MNLDSINSSLGISISITSEHIYRDNISNIKMISQSEFSIKIPYEIIELIRGAYSFNNLKSTEADNGRHAIEFNVIGLFNEKAIRTPSSNYTADHYGMRYFPFISSTLIFHLETLDLPIRHIIIDLPQEFRIIWYGGKIQSPNLEIANLRHSYSSDRAKYLATWKDSESISGQYLIEVPLRLSAESLFKLIHFPIAYWILALIIVAISAFSEKNTILSGTIVASWVFMLRYWNQSNIPQANALLTWMYIVAALILLIWGLTLKFFGYIGFFWSFFIALTISHLRSNLSHFINTGYLLRNLEKYWSALVYYFDKKQKSNWDK